MPALQTTYFEGPPELLVELMSGDDGYALILGVVDSGADRSMFPLEIADLLGIPDALVKDEVLAGGAAGPGFPTWSSSEEIRGQIVRLTDDRELFPWGPEFPMNPAFAESEHFLLGREDFFVPFVVSFGLHEGHRAFSVSY